jgi:GntR family transcriptional regulator, rspAB operon transcriptional repressor
LKSQIVKLELRPNQTLIEQVIGNQFGVSRTPVREALGPLAVEGLVDNSLWRGIVSPIHVRAVKDARYVRECLEVTMGRDAAEKCTDLGILNLRHHLDQRPLACERSDVGGFYRVDEDMHRQISLIAGHPFVLEVVLDAKVHMDRVRPLVLTERISEIPGLIRDHKAIVDAIGRQNPGDADAAMRRHLKLLLRDWESLIVTKPDCFEEAESLS